MIEESRLQNAKIYFCIDTYKNKACILPLLYFGKNEKRGKTYYSFVDLVNNLRILETYDLSGYYESLISVYDKIGYDFPKVGDDVYAYKLPFMSNKIKSGTIVEVNERYGTFRIKFDFDSEGRNNGFYYFWDLNRWFFLNET